MKLELERQFKIKEFASFDAEQTWEIGAEYTLEFQIQGETKKAYKVICLITEDDFEEKKSFYLPKSQVEKNDNDNSLTLPEWLANKQDWRVRLITGCLEKQINQKITVE